MSRLAEIVGLNVRRLRQERMLTEEQLAKRCGLLGSSIARIERGEGDMGLETLERLAHGFGVVPSHLLERMR